MSRDYEVVISKPGIEFDWCAYDDCEIKRTTQTTTAVIRARDEQHLREKMASLYPGVEIIRIK